MSVTFSGYHLFDGVLFVRDDVTTAFDCIASCAELSGECAGVDFDNRTRQCFHHNMTTECAQFELKPFCTHYRLTDQCPTTTAQPTTTTTTPAPTTTTPEPTTRAPLQVPSGANTCHLILFTYFPLSADIFSGFASAEEGVHILDGLLVASDVSEQQCLDACLMFSSCLAVDYNIATNECYVHNTTTYCAETTSKPLCRHYKRAPCIEG